jgi:hypothetical protein
MTLHTLSLLIRGSVNPGVIAGTAVATEEEDKHNKNISRRGRIIGAAVAAVLLIVIIVFAVCYDRSKKRKARQGTKLRTTGAGDIDEEARPMVQGPVGVPPPLMMQPGGTYFPPQYFPPQGEGMYAGNAYGQGSMHMPAGQQGTQFYRNQ